MNKLQEILESYSEDSFITMDGFDDAVIGVDESSMRLIYSTSKCIDELSKSMTYDEALEYYYFNIDGSHIDGKPILCNDL